MCEPLFPASIGGYSATVSCCFSLLGSTVEVLWCWQDASFAPTAGKPFGLLSAALVVLNTGCETVSNKHCKDSGCMQPRSCGRGPTSVNSRQQMHVLLNLWSESTQSKITPTRLQLQLHAGNLTHRVCTTVLVLQHSANCTLASTPNVLDRTQLRHQEHRSQLKQLGQPCRKHAHALIARRERWPTW